MRARAARGRASMGRVFVEALERRVLLHGIGPDGKPIDDGGADDGPAGSILVTDGSDGVANPAWDNALFDLDAVRFNGGPGAYSGQAYIGQRGVWLKTSTAGVAEHEFGHNFGNWHANAWIPNDPQTIIGPGTNQEYGDPF